MVFDSDFLVVTVAFNCADKGLAGGFTDSTGAAGAFASIRALGFTAALPGTLLAVFSVAGAGFALPGLSADLTAPAFLVGTPAGAFAALGLSVTDVFLSVENIGILAGFFIAFAMESTIN